MNYGTVLRFKSKERVQSRRFNSRKWCVGQRCKVVIVIFLGDASHFVVVKFNGNVEHFALDVID